MELQAKAFVFTSPPRKNDVGPGLKITAKCYTTSSSMLNVQGLTLLLAHCIGSHKEQWEPTIQRLFDLQSSKADTHRVREAWAFDWQNHGDAAILNCEALKSRTDGVSVYEWYPAISAFVRSAHMVGHHIVLLGHSAGAAAMYASELSDFAAEIYALEVLLTLTTKDFHVSGFPFAAIILIEPTMVTKELWNAHLDDRMASMDLSVAATSLRRDKWPSRGDALTYFRSRIPWKVWDPRVARLMVEYGLEDMPSGGVTLKCDRKQEAVSYPDTEPHFEATLQLGRICHAIPVHIIWGERNNLVPDFMQDSLCDISEGRIAASVTKIKCAGHMVVQEQPDRLAKSISEALSTISSASSVERSKL